MIPMSDATVPETPVRPSDVIRFVLDGAVRTLHDVPPTRTVLQMLREDLGRTGTKEGCAEGDCGACTVVLVETDGETGDELRCRAVNSCIQFVPTLDGKALVTVEDLKGPRGTLHPVQAAMVDCHGSQCGFCTPGFVMSLFASYKSVRAPDRAALSDALAGNLCRCTGYRPILDAGVAMGRLADAVPADQHDWISAPYGLRTERVAATEQALVAMLKSIARSTQASFGHANGQFFAPHTLAELTSIRAALPDARLLAGGTDVGLWVTKQHRDLGDLIYTGTVAELKRIETTSTHLEIGAAVTLSDVMRPLATHFPDFRELLRRYGSPPIRHAATLGGNIANGSPIGDSMPALIVLGATVVLRASDTTREMPLEDFYLGYQKTVLGRGEFVERIRIPLPEAALAFRTYKISKRFDQDISALCGAFAARIVNGRIGSIRIAFGGMAATAARARATEAALLDQPWTEATVRIAQAALETDYAPISDMRASATYRRTVAGNLLKKFFIETNARVSRHPSRLYDLRDLRDLRNEGNVGDVPV